jgi:hypothetical protein
MWYGIRGTLRLLSVFWSSRRWSNIGLSFQGFFSSIGASAVFFFYVWLTLTALLVTATAILITAVCLKRLFFSIAGKQLESH